MAPTRYFFYLLLKANTSNRLLLPTTERTKTRGDGTREQCNYTQCGFTVPHLLKKEKYIITSVLDFEPTIGCSYILK